MNYIKIHDSIIDRAKTRSPTSLAYYERHHIIPKCEGGDPNGDLVHLTIKEHRLVHLLRYKMTNVVGNLRAYYMMTNRSYTSVQLQASEAAKALHQKKKSNDPVAYIEHQRRIGVLGGTKCFVEKIGFHAMSAEERSKIGRQAGELLAKRKVGMFSDAYREYHKTQLHKKIHTPAGIFDSASLAAKHYGIGQGLVTYRTNSQSKRFADWYYLPKEEHDE